MSEELDVLPEPNSNPTDTPVLPSCASPASDRITKPLPKPPPKPSRVPPPKPPRPPLASHSPQQQHRPPPPCPPVPTAPLLSTSEICAASEEEEKNGVPLSPHSLQPNQESMVAATHIEEDIVGSVNTPKQIEEPVAQAQDSPPLPAPSPAKPVPPPVPQAPKPELHRRRTASLSPVSSSSRS